MSDDVNITLSAVGLDKLIKAFGSELPQVKIGILGDGARSGSKQTNAEIGYRHENGIGVPKRSFLREPLENNLAQYLEDSGAFDAEVLADVIKGGDVKPWMQKVGAVAEQVVADGFDSGGFGQWQALSPRTLANKKNKMILVETTQLRNSISSEVEGG